MKKIYALFMTLCLIISATAAPLAGVAKKSYPLYQPEVVKAELASSMHKAPAATQGLQYDAEAGELIRYYNETDQIAIDADYLAQGNLYIDIMAGDKSDYLTLLLFVEDTVEGAIIPEGTYPITSTPAYNTALASQGYVAGEGVYPCAYYPLVEQGGTLYINTPMYFMQSGNIVVEHVNGAPKITINAVNSNNVPMTIVYEVGGKSEKVEVKTPLQYDATAADGALDYTYGEDAVAETTDKGFYGMLDVADATSMLALLFVYPEGVADAETTIPAGTYTISDSQAAGTVLASSGVSNTGGVGYSFYAKTNAQGQLVPPLYFPVEGTVEVTKVDGKLKVEVNALNSNDVPVHVVYDATSAEPEYALEETVEISNLTTDILTVGEATYLQLTGRNDMLDSDVQLFLNNYTGEDKEYEVNVENSLMTFGGIELTVVEGKIAQATDPEKGKVYTGRVIASAEEEGEVMLVALDLIMYAAPAIELEIADAQAIVDETTGTLLFTASWTDTTTMVAYPVMVTVAGFEDVEFKEYEGAQISELQIGDDDNWYDYAVANAVAVFKDGNAVALEGEYTSWATGATYYVTIEGTLPVVEDSKPEPTYTENNLNPYAFGLESVLSDDKTTLTVTYRLNNSNATSVNVLVYNGEDIVASVPGTTTIGKNTVEVATGNLPAGVELKWAVEVNGTSVEAPTQDEKMFSLYCPHGLAIDTDPESENFGRILVAEAMQAVPASGYVTSGKGAGLYVFNPSFTTDSVTYTGGNDFTRILASNGYQPWRVKISEDGRIFVSSLDLNGVVVWEVSKDLQTWTPVIAGTNDATDYNIYDAEGNFIAGPNCSMDVIGSGEDLKLLLYSTNNKGIAFNQSGYRLDEYALGTATTWTGLPKNILEGGKLGLVHTNVEFIYDGEGGYWFGASRAGNAGQPNLVHINAAGEQDYYTEDASLYGGDGVLVHNGMLFKGKARTSSTVGNFGVWTIGKDADGKVTLTEKWTVAANGIGRNLNEFAVDYAENLYIVGNSGEKIIAYALPYSGKVETPAAAKYAFQLPEPLKMAGIVKRAVQNGDAVIVLTHEADGTAHIYQVVDGKAVAEVSLEGVLPVDTENPGSYLAISDIAVTEDGKLVANNYNRCSFNDGAVESGYKRGTLTFYIWNDLAAAPAIWFQSKASSNSNNSDQGYTMALTGTSTNANILVSGVHNTQRGVRMSHFSVVDGVFEDTQDGSANLPYYYYIGSNFKGASAGADAAVFNEQTQGANIQFHASPLADENWIIDGELTNPIEFTNPQVHGGEVVVKAALTEDLGKKYNGASYVTVGEKVLMVAPFANPDGELVGAEILNITNGFDAPQYVDMVYVDEAVAATAAATAVEVVEGGLNITLVADNAIHTWFVEMSEGTEYEVYEEEITNLVIDLDNLVLMGGPGSAFQVEVYLPLGEYNMSEDSYQLTSESSIAVLGSDATFIEGYAYEVDAFTPSAKAVVRCEWNGMLLEFRLTMTAAPLEPTVVVVENAAIEIEKYLLWGDMYDYALKMSGEWINPEDGLTYPVLVEVPVYYPEATEPSEIMSTVTVGGNGDDDPWLGFGEGTLTVTTETLSAGDKLITATGIVQNPMAGVAIDITISGSITPTGVENATVTVKSVKMIQNGQLIIKKGDAQYNAQGATLK